jgi:hypothetical protein
MTLTVVRTETQAKQRKKEKQNMAIHLSDIRNAAVDYFSSLVVPSITVNPIPVGVATEVNPGEQFNITLTVKNSVDDPDQGIQLNNVRYHVNIDDVTKATLIVPSSSVAVAREKSSSSSRLLKEGDEVAEMFLFPPDDILEAGATGSVSIRGHALTAGTRHVNFDLHADVDLGYLFPVNQQSPDTSHSVSIVT